MSDSRNALLLATLQRAGSPMDSDALLDAATGLALAEGWTPEQVAHLSRRSVATRLQNMQAGGLVVQEGTTIDPTARRTTPLYRPAASYDAHAVVPGPPSVSAAPPAKESAYDSMDRTQLLAVLDGHDDIAECVSRFLTDLNNAREKVRRRLQAVGLGSH